MSQGGYQQIISSELAVVVMNQKAMHQRQKDLSALKGMAATTPPPIVQECGAQCHGLWTRPHNNTTNKSTKAGQDAEQDKLSQTKHQGHTHWTQPQGHQPCGSC